MAALLIFIFFILYIEAMFTQLAVLTLFFYDFCIKIKFTLELFHEKMYIGLCKLVIQFNY
ncbi:hypothetical protein DMN77_19680 [Paenibacillus sp. 79R4]|nr:hypothetical protein [Paenibacillus sp. 79R4]